MAAPQSGKGQVPELAACLRPPLPVANSPWPPRPLPGMASDHPRLRQAATASTWLQAVHAMDAATRLAVA